MCDGRGRNSTSVRSMAPGRCCRRRRVAPRVLLTRVVGGMVALPPAVGSSANSGPYLHGLRRGELGDLLGMESPFRRESVPL